ncbi:hypothetical protein [Amycolatopsis benzoatilytica]|uniref:hypothetical protein n=1 Tax=Amycolatopsis benzoatilytica TaxID=346045 RepID=UPI00037D79F3|nr:hypothetical protein [Amycolatopsis benzoatilytica]
MGWWISYDGTEIDTDPDTGSVICEDQTVRIFAESMLSHIQRGITVKALAERTGLDEFLIGVALDVAREHRLWADTGEIIAAHGLAE